MVADARLSESNTQTRSGPRFTVCEHTGYLASENLLLPGHLFSWAWACVTQAGVHAHTGQRVPSFPTRAVRGLWAGGAGKGRGPHTRLPREDAWKTRVIPAQRDTK